MHAIQTLGIALGLATLAGLNLYLTVFVTGLAIGQGWIVLAPEYDGLSVLGHPAVVIIAGILFTLEFFADKVPWIDSVWDSIHTFIRPIGGAMIAARVLGTTDPAFEVIAVLLAGGVTLASHSVKAGTRLLVNHSPEPFSNVAVSVAEDAMVLGGLWLIWSDPLVAAMVFTVVFAVMAYIVPRLFRSMRLNLWLLWRKLSAPASDDSAPKLEATLPADLHVLFHDANLLGEKIAWAVPCVVGVGRRLPTYARGYLVATDHDLHSLWFVGKRGWRKVAEEMDLTTYKAVHESRFLSDNLVLYSLEKKPRYVFLFDRPRGPMCAAAAREITRRLATPLPEPASAVA